MKVLIVGSTGMLGKDCYDLFSKDHEVIAPGKDELDITSWDGVIESLQNILPDVIINCAAFTDMDACEKEDFLRQRVNVEGPRNLAQCSARFECRMVHISCDYVFDGKKPMPQPYFEDDLMASISAYGQSKIESEKAVRENAPNYMILRTAWLYGMNGDNFVRSIVNQAVNKKGLDFKVANDQLGSPTWTYRLALQIRELLNSDAKGTYHVTAEDYCSRLECARYVLKKLRLEDIIESCGIKDFKAPPGKPANCVLENRLLKRQGMNNMRHWKDDMNIFLKQFGQQLIEELKTT
jgi:dTDP-4-dehydrorhamnose reductase